MALSHAAEATRRFAEKVQQAQVSGSILSTEFLDRTAIEHVEQVTPGAGSAKELRVRAKFEDAIATGLASALGVTPDIVRQRSMARDPSPAHSLVSAASGGSAAGAGGTAAGGVPLTPTSLGSAAPKSPSSLSTGSVTPAAARRVLRRLEAMASEGGSGGSPGARQRRQKQEQQQQKEQGGPVLEDSGSVAEWVGIAAEAGLTPTSAATSRRSSRASSRASSHGTQQL